MVSFIVNILELISSIMADVDCTVFKIASEMTENVVQYKINK